MKPISYRYTAYPSAWLAGIAGFLYSVCFVLSARSIAPVAGGAALFLLLGSALLGLYERLTAANGAYALWCLVFGLAAAIAATLHGGYDLANAIHPQSGSGALPSEVDPRGLGTFGLAGISLLGFAYLILRDTRFPRGFGYLAVASGVLLVLVYLARLIILSPSNPLVLGVAGVEGFIVNPAWYVWLGFALRRQES